MKRRCPKCDYLNDLRYAQRCWHCAEPLENRDTVDKILKEVFGDH